MANMEPDTTERPNTMHLNVESSPVTDNVIQTVTDKVRNMSGKQQKLLLQMLSRLENTDTVLASSAWNEQPGLPAATNACKPLPILRQSKQPPGSHPTSPKHSSLRSSPSSSLSELPKLPSRPQSPFSNRSSPQSPQLQLSRSNPQSPHRSRSSSKSSSPSYKSINSPSSRQQQQHGRKPHKRLHLRRYHQRKHLQRRLQQRRKVFRRN